jgi:hypothetical protein
MKIFLLAVGMTLACATLAKAGPIERACMRSVTGNGSPALCGCIQQVADMTLHSSDQRRAARFFTDPQRAQDVRASDTVADNAFWQRYTAAQQYCRN